MRELDGDERKGGGLEGGMGGGGQRGGIMHH